MEFIYLGRELFPTWYRDLLYRARAQAVPRRRGADPSATNA